MKPFQPTDAAALGLSWGLPSRPEARMALTSEAKISDHSRSGSELRATYSGLMPSGSRATTSLRSCMFQWANANIPRNSANRLATVDTQRPQHHGSVP